MQNNPAVHLYDLTRRLRSTSGNGSPATLWAQALSIPVNHETTSLPLIPIIKGILAFLDLVNETERGMHELGFDDFYSEAFPPLRRVVQVSLSNLRANQPDLTRPITDETLTLLRVIAAEWEKKKPAPKIDEAVLKEIHAEAHDLFEAVKSAEFDGDLKRLILSLTSEIEQAIQQYRISGPESLKRALSLINLNIETLDKAKGNERAKIWWTRFYKVAVKFSELVKFVGDTRKTIEAISPLVRLVGGAPDEIAPVDLHHQNKP